MKLRVKAVVDYDIELDKNDIEKIKGKINKEKLSPFITPYLICDLVLELYEDGEISLYDEKKCAGSNLVTELIEISPYEERTINEILSLGE